MQFLSVVLECLNGQHPVSKKERESEKTPLIFELDAKTAYFQAGARRPTTVKNC